MKSETFKIAMIRKLSLQISMEVVLFLFYLNLKQTHLQSVILDKASHFTLHILLCLFSRGGEGGAINQIPHSRCSAPQVQEDSVHFLTLIF